LLLTAISFITIPLVSLYKYDIAIMVDTAPSLIVPSPTPTPQVPQPVLLNLAHSSTFQHVVDVEGIWNGMSLLFYGI
jgi:hypothetical protein